MKSHTLSSTRVALALLVISWPGAAADSLAPSDAPVIGVLSEDGRCIAILNDDIDLPCMPVGASPQRVRFAIDILLVIGSPLGLTASGDTDDAASGVPTCRENRNIPCAVGFTNDELGVSSGAGWTANGTTWQVAVYPGTEPASSACKLDRDICGRTLTARFVFD